MTRPEGTVPMICHVSLRSNRDNRARRVQNQRVPSFPLLSLVLLRGLCLAPEALAIRRIVEEVQLVNPTEHSNPRHGELDPLVQEMQQQLEDLEWTLQHHSSADKGAMNLDLQSEGSHMSDEEKAFLAAGMGKDAYMFDDVDSLDDMDSLDDVEAEDFQYGFGFNISERLIQLFPLIDVDPPDARLSLGELTAWHVRLGLQGSEHRTHSEMEASDADEDGLVTLAEALLALGIGDPSDDSVEEMRATETVKFLAADLNNDSMLNFTEFHDFLHPEESDNQALHEALLAEEMRRRDLDGDGQLNKNEFEMTSQHDLGQMMEQQQKQKPKHEDSNAKAHETTEASNDGGVHHPNSGALVDQGHVDGAFERLDVNKDGLIGKDEFKVVMRVLWPSTRDFAAQHSAELIHEADTNGDSFLTLEEMLEHAHVFYRTVDDIGDSPDHSAISSHDEF